MKKKNELPFTKIAQEVLDYAKKSATDLKQVYIGTENILLGLIKIPCIASEILEEFGVTYDRTMELISKYVLIDGAKNTGRKKPTWSAKAEAIIESARFEAETNNCSNVGTEHIAMALIYESDSTAVRLLNTMDVDEDNFHYRLYKAMGLDRLRLPDVDMDAIELPFGGFLERSDSPVNNGNVLEQFSTDLTKLAKEDKLDPIIGRKSELARIIRTLSRRSKNNPCLIGEPGVGKSAIIDGLARLMADGDVPDTLRGKKLLSLNLTSMVAGTKYRGEFEARIDAVIKEVSSSKNIILFLDEIHTLIGTGGAEGSLDAANILKPALSRGDIQIIGATTVDEYRKHIEKDAALARRFQSIMVEEPSETETIKILKGLRGEYEKHHAGIKISDDAITACVKLATRYINDRFLPDKAIDLLDETCAKIRLEMDTNVVDEEKIAAVVSEMTGIPVSKLTESENEKLLKLEDKLHKRVISQDEAVTAVARAVRRSRIGLKDPSKPIGSFFFLGPTGVGKTELAKTLAQALFGREEALVRVDMSEYMESHSVSKLIGSPPGYVGFDEGGQLCEQIRRNPYSVVLLDEIEKAHPDIFHVLLQILDDGHITDSQGRKVDFKNTIIIMTSNIGASRIIDPKKLGFNANESPDDNYNNMKNQVMDEVKKLFKPELLNRIDEVLIFKQLGKEDIRKILTIQLRALSARTKESLKIKLRFTKAAKDHLIEKGFDIKYGARPLKRTIQTEVEDKLATKILSGEIEKDEITVDYTDGKMVFN